MLKLLYINFIQKKQKNIKNLTVQPADIIEKIEMSAFIRETTSKLITIINPLSSPVQITKEMLTSDNDNITFNPPSFKIPSNSVLIIKQKNIHIYINIKKNK
jgi:hypothetical protein